MLGQGYATLGTTRSRWSNEPGGSASWSRGEDQSPLWAFPFRVITCFIAFLDLAKNDGFGTEIMAEHVNKMFRSVQFVAYCHPPVPMEIGSEWQLVLPAMLKLEPSTYSLSDFS